MCCYGTVSAAFPQHRGRRNRANLVTPRVYLLPVCDPFGADIADDVLTFQLDRILTALDTLHLILTVLSASLCFACHLKLPLC